MIEAPIAAKPDAAPGWLLNHFPVILWQRRLYLIAAFLLIFVLGVAAAFTLPTLYRSTATLLVQSQDLPVEVAQSPVTGSIEQRIARIRERVLSRGDLITLIEQNDLYPDERRSKPLSKVIEKMRRATSVSALSGDIGQPGGGQSNTIAVTMTFDYPEPAKAQAVLQSYVSRFLRMDSEDLEDQAGLTVRFLQDQAGKLQVQIRQIEGQLTALKARHGSALASSGLPPMIDTGSYSAEIANLENQNRQLLASLRKGPGKDPELAAAESALANARAIYNDSHPDVVQARERLEMIRQIERAQAQPDEAETVQAQISANNAAIASLVAARNSTVSRASSLQAGQARAPAVLEQAMQLENRASALREQYKDVSTNLLKAQNSARMASEQRAERLSLVDPPNLPDRPHSPNRPLIIIGAAAAGLMIGLMLALALELLLRPLRSPGQIEALGFPVLGVVPILGSSRNQAGPRALLRWWERRFA